MSERCKTSRVKEKLPLIILHAVRIYSILYTVPYLNYFEAGYDRLLVIDNLRMMLCDDKGDSRSILATGGHRWSLIKNSKAN